MNVGISEEMSVDAPVTQCVIALFSLVFYSLFVSVRQTFSPCAVSLFFFLNAILSYTKLIYSIHF